MSFTPTQRWSQENLSHQVLQKDAAKRAALQAQQSPNLRAIYEATQLINLLDERTEDLEAGKVVAMICPGGGTGCGSIPQLVSISVICYPHVVSHSDGSKVELPQFAGESLDFPMFAPYSLNRIPGFSATRCQRQAEQLLRSRNASQVGVNWTRRRSSSWSEAVTCNCGASSRRTRLGCQCASLGVKHGETTWNSPTLARIQPQLGTSVSEMLILGMLQMAASYFWGKW